MTEFRKSLREELSGPGDPDFTLELPRGWSRREVNAESKADFVEAVSRTLMQAHQPMIMASVQRMLDEAFDGMRRAGAFAYFAPIDPPADAPAMTASIIARVRRASAGESLDDLVGGLIHTYGAEPLRGDYRILRYEEETNVRIESQTIVNNSITYLTPVPGARRGRALELVASIVRPVEMAADLPRLVAQKNLIDLCVASLRWTPSPSDDQDE